MNDDDEITTDDIIRFLYHRGYIKEGDLTHEGREWLRAAGASVPDDKSLVTIGLEAIVDEVIGEEMEKTAGRKTAEGTH